MKQPITILFSAAPTFEESRKEMAKRLGVLFPAGNNPSRDEDIQRLAQGVRCEDIREFVLNRDNFVESIAAFIALNAELYAQNERDGLLIFTVALEPSASVQ